MRKKYVIGNWKMNKDVHESVQLARGIVDGVSSADTRVVITPPFTSLQTVGDVIKNTSVMLGAQNVSAHESGAHTGEISVGMLKALGVSYVIVGHSERRTLYHEVNADINKKVHAVLANGFKTVLCIGETLEEREGGRLRTVIDEQLIGGLASVSSQDIKNIIVAYEPVWAIGTGKTATAQEANEVHKMIRARIVELYNQDIADSTTILYGGSVKPANAGQLIAEEHIDGFLVGGACLEADSFISIIKEVS